MVYEKLSVPLNIHMKFEMIGYWARKISAKIIEFCFIMCKCLLYRDSLGIYTSPYIACKETKWQRMLYSWLLLSKEVSNVTWVRKGVKPKTVGLVDSSLEK